MHESVQRQVAAAVAISQWHRLARQAGSARALCVGPTSAALASSRQQGTVSIGLKAPFALPTDYSAVLARAALLVLDCHFSTKRASRSPRSSQNWSLQLGSRHFHRHFFSCTATGAAQRAVAGILSSASFPAAHLTMGSVSRPRCWTISQLVSSLVALSEPNKVAQVS